VTLVKATQPFKVDRSGNIFSTTNAYQVLTTNSVLNGAKVTDPVTTLAANYTATGSDSVLLGNAASAGFTVTLPSAATMTGETLLVKKIDATTNAVTLATTGSQTIDGATTYALTVQNATFSVISDGSNWRVSMIATGGTQLNIYGGPSSSGSFTWTKPSWAKTVRVVVVGAGAGGGSGRRGAAASARTGGAGGGGGSINESTFPASLLPATVAINIQPGGAGGVAVSTDSTSGNAGVSISGLTPTSFGTVPLAVRVYGALAGGAGTTAAATGGQGTNNMFSGGVGGVSSPSAAASAIFNVSRGASGGGAGGSLSTGDVILSGSAGAGYPAVTYGVITSSSVGGASGGTTDGAVGAAPTDNPSGVDFGAQGGGGGAASKTSTGGGKGGNGAWPGGGGGGGGASLDATGLSGAGGNGANGAVFVISMP